MAVIKRYGYLKEDMPLKDAYKLLNGELDRFIDTINRIPADFNQQTKKIDIQQPPWAISMATTLEGQNKSILGLNERTFTDSTGKIVKSPSASDAGLFVGATHLGFFDGSNWKSYMADNGNFYLTGRAGGDYLSWVDGLLTIRGNINITGGNAATADDIFNVSQAVMDEASVRSSADSGLNSSIGNVAAGLSDEINSRTQAVLEVQSALFTDSSGRIFKTPSLSGTGLFLGAEHLGFYNGSAWKTYMSNTGNFYLTGNEGGNFLTWVDGVLTINGAINVTGGNAATAGQIQTLSQELTDETAARQTDVSGLNNSLSSEISTRFNADNTLQGNINTVTGNLSNLAAKVFTDATGKFVGVAAPSGSGLYMDSTRLGYHSGQAWKTYMDNEGNFYLSGSGTHNLLWNGSALAISGNITGSVISGSSFNINYGIHKISIDDTGGFRIKSGLGYSGVATLLDASTLKLYGTSVDGKSVNTIPDIELLGGSLGGEVAIKVSGTKVSLEGHMHTNGTSIGGPYSLSSHTHINDSNIGGPYSLSTHNHSGVYQPAGSYALASHSHVNDANIGGPYSLSTHNHTGVYQPAGSYQAALSGTGFVKISGTSISYDNNSYALSTHNHAGTYEPANSNIQTHVASTLNPHSVTKAQVGLDSVPNTDATNPANIVWNPNYRTVTDAQISNWNNSFGASHSHDNKGVLDGITSIVVLNWNTAFANMHSHDNKADLDGITSTLITQWNTAYTNSHAHTNKTVLDGITSALIGQWNIAYTNNHTHANKTDLDGITTGLITNWNTAYTNTHTHANKAVLDNLTQAVIDNSHTHANKTYLDTINQPMGSSDYVAFGQITSNAAQGTAPFVVGSTTQVNNLNADLWQGWSRANYLDQAVKTTSSPTLSGLSVTNGVTAKTVNLPSLSTSTVGVGISIGSSYGTSFAQGANTSANFEIFHNATIGRDASNAAEYKWVTSHASFGSRGIRLSFSDGISFFANTATTTAGTAFTPSRRMLIGNDGNIVVDSGNLTIGGNVTANSATLGTATTDGGLTAHGTGTTANAKKRAISLPGYDSTGATAIIVGNWVSSNNWGIGGLSGNYLRFGIVDANSAFTADANIQAGSGKFSGNLFINGSSTGATTYLQFQNSGTNLGIIGSEYSIYGNSTSNFGAYVYGNNQFSIATNGTKRFIVGGNGRIGIGGASLDDTLNVNGNAKFWGIYTAIIGMVLTHTLVITSGKMVLYSPRSPQPKCTLRTS
jgi:hypothetical protein